MSGCTSQHGDPSGGSLSRYSAHLIINPIKRCIDAMAMCIPLAGHTFSIHLMESRENSSQSWCSCQWAVNNHQLSTCPLPQCFNPFSSLTNNKHKQQTNSLKHLDVTFLSPPLRSFPFSRKFTTKRKREEARDLIFVELSTMKFHRCQTRTEKRKFD